MQSARLSSILPLFFGSGLFAVIDGALQAMVAGPSVLAATISFNIIGAWLVCFVFCLAIFIAPRAFVLQRTTFGVGLVIGALPLLHSLLPFPFSHLTFILLLALVIFIKPIKAPQLFLCGISSMALLVLTVVSVFLPHNLPAHPTAPSATATSHSGPDVVLISVDTLRSDSVYAQQDIGLELPTLSGLRQRSLWADYALSSSNQTLPGHLGMLSGLSATSHGVRSNRDLPDPSISLAAQYFATAGYQTSAVISNALLSSATDMHRGFTNFSDEAIGLARLSMLSQDYLARHSWLSMLLQSSGANRLFRTLFYRHKYRAQSISEKCTDIALAQLDAAYQSEQPLFQFIHLMDPHTNYAPPASVRGTISSPLATKIHPDFLPLPTAEITVAMVRNVQTKLQKGDVDSALAATYYHLVYLEEVIEVDRQLQRIVDKLDQSGRPYVLLLTADHGEQFAEHGLMDHANSLYEENIRVPFLLSGSGVPAAHITGVPQLCDVLPTLLSYAGVDYDASDFDGWAVGQVVAARPHVAVDQKEIAVRDVHGLKWIGAWQDADQLPLGVKLFNLKHGESNNLINNTESLASNLLDLIDYYYENDTYTTRQASAKTSAAQQAALNSLGYADQEDDR
jgi:arylsulfatase